MGVLRVLGRLFTGSTQVQELTSDAVLTLTRQVAALGHRIDQLEERVESQRVELVRFRGRVYAWKGHELPPEPTERPAELPLSDPRLTKAEVKQRLLQSGSLVPGKPFKHN